MATPTPTILWRKWQGGCFFSIASIAHLFECCSVMRPFVTPTHSRKPSTVYTLCHTDSSSQFPSGRRVAWEASLKSKLAWLRHRSFQPSRFGQQVCDYVTTCANSTAMRFQSISPAVKWAKPNRFDGLAVV